MFETRILTGAAALLLAGLGMASTASAADLPAKVLPAPAAPAPESIPIDFVFGARGVSDYNFRGISQNNRNPGYQAYGEVQGLDNMLYAGIAFYQVDLATRPSAEIDLTAGIRPKFDKFTFDLGVIYYLYPSEKRLFDGLGTFFTPANTDFLEIAGRVSYAATDNLTFGAGVFYAYDWLGSGADATYINGTVKYVLPENTVLPTGVFFSAEVATYQFGRTSPQLGSVNLPDYLYGNVGVGYNYKNFTFDLRYHDTDLKSSDCFLLTSDPRGIATGSFRSNWCSSAIVASLQVEIQASSPGIFAPPGK